MDVSTVYSWLKQEEKLKSVQQWKAVQDCTKAIEKKVGGIFQGIQVLKKDPSQNLLSDLLDSAEQSRTESEKIIDQMIRESIDSILQDQSPEKEKLTLDRQRFQTCQDLMNRALDYLNQAQNEHKNNNSTVQEIIFLKICYSQFFENYKMIYQVFLKHFGLESSEIFEVEKKPIQVQEATSQSSPSPKRGVRRWSSLIKKRNKNEENQ